jgi:hypothetical protein
MSTLPALASRSLLFASLLALAWASPGCFRSRTLSPPTAPPPAESDAGADGKRDAALDGKLDTAPDGARDVAFDGPRDRGDDPAPDASDGARADLAPDGKLDGLLDGPLDGPWEVRLDGNRDLRTDGSADGKPDSFVCAAVETCGNGVDDDCDGLVDCKDPGCMSDPACIDRKKETCDNGKDDDGNGLVDCKDPACSGDPACATPGVEVCNNNLDDDSDGLVDCNDPDCAKDPTCVVTPGDEICDNGKDDNGDGLVDCSDPKCKSFAACLKSDCTPDVDFGAIAPSGTSVTRTMSTVGATASFATCASPGGGARVGGFSLASAADVKLDFTQPSGSAHVVSLFRAGVGQACDQNLVDCLAVGDKLGATKTYTALPPGSYWLVVQSFPGTPGSTTVTLSTGKAGTAEICDNGIDDDLDGAIDCADLDCATAKNCHRCVPDINLGTLVVGGPSKSATVDTTKSSNRYHPSIAGVSTGNDIVVQFSVKETCGLSLQTWQLSGDHIYGVFDAPAAGAACDSTERQSTDLDQDYYKLMDWTFFSPGDYLLIFKARTAGSEGTLSIVLSAFANRRTELCDNGIDDDDDQLVDCADPDCASVPSCTATMCLPDGDLGDIDVGTKVSVHVDLTTATQTYQADCSKGDGRGRAYRVNLLKPMTLDFFCTQTGDQVLAIGPQISPLDACDAHITDCADPTIGDIGCNFGIPDLQPGVHYVIVQAVSSGNEGTMDLTLQGEAQRTDEICNNGIDDDGDGAIDCDDRKCATNTACQNLRCLPDKNLGLLPLDGSTRSVAVETSGAGDDQVKSKCVSAAGGEDAVIGFELPGTTDLTIEWAQVGNHALVLYRADSVPLPCEANQLVDCTQTKDLSTGSYPLRGLAAGKYYLVVDADHTGAEGGVIVQLSGHSATP